MGGEPLEMREYLIAQGIKPGRLVLFTGGFVTTNNIDTLIQFAKQVFVLLFQLLGAKKCRNLRKRHAK